MEPVSKGDTALQIAIVIVKRGRIMCGRKENTAFLTGLSEDLISVTICAVDARSIDHIISVHLFLKGR